MLLPIVSRDVKTKDTGGRDMFKFLHRKFWHDEFTLYDLDNEVTLKSIIEKGE